MTFGLGATIRDGLGWAGVTMVGIIAKIIDNGIMPAHLWEVWTDWGNLRRSYVWLCNR